MQSIFLVKEYYRQINISNVHILESLIYTAHITSTEKELQDHHKELNQNISINTWQKKNISIQSKFTGYTIITFNSF